MIKVFKAVALFCLLKSSYEAKNKKVLFKSLIISKLKYMPIFEFTSENS